MYLSAKFFLLFFVLIVSISSKGIENSNVNDSVLVKKNQERKVFFRVIPYFSDTVNVGKLNNSILKFGYSFIKFYKNSERSSESFTINYLPNKDNLQTDPFYENIKKQLSQLNLERIKSIDFIFSVDKNFEDSIFLEKNSNWYFEFVSSDFLKISEKEGGLFDGDVKSLTSAYKPIVKFFIDSSFVCKNDFSIINRFDSLGYRGAVSLFSKDSIISIFYDSTNIDSNFFDEKYKKKLQILNNYQSDLSSFSFIISEDKISTKINEKNSVTYTINKNINRDLFVQILNNLQYYKIPKDSAVIKLILMDNNINKVLISKNSKLSLKDRKVLIETLKKFKIENHIGREEVIIEINNLKIDKSLLSKKILKKTNNSKILKVQDFKPKIVWDKSKLISIYRRFIKTDGNFIGNISFQLFIGKNGKVDSISRVSDNINFEKFSSLISKYLMDNLTVDLNKNSIVNLEIIFESKIDFELVKYKEMLINRKKYLTSKQSDSISYLTRLDFINCVNDSSKRIEKLLTGRADFKNLDTLELKFTLDVDNRGNVMDVISDTSLISKSNISVYKSIYFDIGRWRFKKTEHKFNYSMDFSYKYIVPDSLKRAGKDELEQFYYRKHFKNIRKNSKFPKFFFIGGIAFNSLDSLKKNLYNHSTINTTLTNKSDKLSSFSQSGYAFYFSAGLNYPNYIFNNFIVGLYTDFQYQINNEVTNLIFNGNGLEALDEFNQTSYWSGVSVNFFYSIRNNFISLNGRDDFLIKFAFGRTLYNHFYVDELRNKDTYFRYSGTSENQYYSHIGFVFNKRVNNKSTGIELGYRFLMFNNIKHQDIESNIKYSEIDASLSDNDIELDYSGLVFRAYAGF